MTLQEWLAQQGHRGVVPPPVAADVAPPQSAEPDPFIGRHATAGDSPDSAFIGELARTGKEAAIGLARSPWDAVKGLLGLPKQAYKGLTEDLPALVKDPSLLLEADAAARNGLSAITDPKTDPREMGSLLGQTLLGEHVAPKLPGAVNSALREGPSMVGRGVSKVSRGVEAVGNSGPLRKAQKLAPLELLTGHPVAAGISAVAPEVLAGAGKLGQRVGGAMEGLDLSFKGRAPFSGTPEYVPQSKEVPGFSYPEVEPNAFTGGQAAEQNLRTNPQTGKTFAGDSAKKTFTHEGFLNDLRRSAGEDVPNGGLTETPAFKGLQESIRKSNLSPAQEAAQSFYGSEPQIGVEGGGRTVGAASTPLAEDVFGPTTGDLNGVAAGSVDPRVSPSALDELSQMSGRALSPEDAQALLNKFQGFRTK